MKKLVIPVLGMILAGLAAAVLFAPPAAEAQAAKAQSAKAQEPWLRLEFLLGEWQGLGSGAPGEGEGGCTFAFGLDRKILVRKNWAKYPPKGGETAGVSHEDLMIVYPAPGENAFRAIYFDNEGHTIEYTSVTFPASGEGAIFETSAAAPGPRFRLVYQARPDGMLDNFFLIAAPGGEFKPYVTGQLKKVRPAK
jgi:hypothetical protein